MLTLAQTALAALAALLLSTLSVAAAVVPGHTSLASLADYV